MSVNEICADGMGYWVGSSRVMTLSKLSIENCSSYWLWILRKVWMSVDGGKAVDL
jgi:hypothetical protein